MPAGQASDWRVAIIGALGRVAIDISNTQFQSWASYPTDITALARSESGGKWTAVGKEGPSSKLGRDYYSFGLFQINELFARGHYLNAGRAIGPAIANVMTPFPATATWTAEQAAAVLLAIPGQLWYAMVLLRGLSQFKNTFFDQLNAQAITPTTSTSKLPSAADRATAASIGTALGNLVPVLKIPPESILTKAFWLASSPAGVKAMLSKPTPDARLKAYAVGWLAEIAAYPQRTGTTTVTHMGSRGQV